MTSLTSSRAAAADALALPAAIRSLAAGASVELPGRPTRSLDEAISALPPGTQAFVVALPHADHHDQLAVAVRAARAGLRPVPHIAARRQESYTRLRDVLARLEGEAGVERALVIAGDAARPAGPFESSLDVLRTGLLPALGITEVCVAGYPEGNPRIDRGSLRAALDEKRALARRDGLDLTIVTQFCFEADVVLDWLGGLRADGVELPVRIGLAGPASVKTLLKYALHCGVGSSIRALGSHASTLTRLLAERGPEPVVRALAETQPAGLEGLHLYPFGGLARTVAWRRAVAAGRFTLDGGAGFRL